MAQEKLISIIDDDESLRMALVGLVRSLGYRSQGFGSAEDYLGNGDLGGSACLITDIQMPGMTGIDLKKLLAERGLGMPVIMITARTEPGLREKAMASGAVCLLHKPFEANALIACIEEALAA